MVKFFKMGALFLLVSLVTACAGAVPWNDQGYSGINKAEIEFDKNGKPKYALIIGGKEQETVNLDVVTPDGLKVTYSASGVKAFTGQEIRGAVEQAVSKDATEIAPEVIDTITKGVLDIVNKPLAVIPGK